MAQLGTLWFGADIDLAKLKQKINEGNKDILNALKIDYDASSYQQMVNKLRASLNREVFEIKLNANSQNLVQNVRQSLSGPKGLMGGMDDINKRILTYSQEVNRLQAEITRLAQSYQKHRNGGFQDVQIAKQEKEQLLSLRSALGYTKRDLADLVAQRDAMRNSTKDTLLMLRRESAEQRKAAQESKQAYAQRTRDVREYTQNHLRLNSTLAGGIHVSTQLGSAMSSLFALDAARQFLGNVIEIGGQLEKQRISIGAILGDTVKANHLFAQIKDLAIKSPFGVVELDQYTKQLSAYGFKYNELFDMTKRLADISAGAGTDIGRLTLALGHVRSATYLTGITLRQFSMNNIPMLKMLADYYTEIEKKAVSTADVQKRISQRKVSYEDVIEQIRRLTDEGGMFYNMQEKISESLAAKFKNLRDAMDIMYGEMAEGSVGDMLKGLAGILLKTTRHWKEIASVLALAAGAFAMSRISIGLQSATMQGNTAATLKKIMADKQVIANNLRAASTYRALSFEERKKIVTANELTATDVKLSLATNELTKDEVLNAIALKKMSVAEAEALVRMGLLEKKEVELALSTNTLTARFGVLGSKLKTAFMGIGTTTWLTLGAMVGMELYMAYDQWVSRIDDKTNEMKDLIKSRINDLNKMMKTIDTEGKPSDSTALKSRVDEMKQVLANSELYTKTLDEQLGKAGGLGEQYDILAKAIGNAVEQQKKSLDYQDAINGMIKASKEGAMSWKEVLTSGSPVLLGIGKIGATAFTDDIRANVGDVLDAYKDMRMVIESLWEYKDAIKDVVDEMAKSSGITEDFRTQLQNAPLEEQLALLAHSPYWDEVVRKIAEQQPAFATYAKRVEEAAGRVTKRWDEITSNDVPQMMRKLAKEMHMSEEKLYKWSLDNVDDFRIMLDGIADQLDAKEPHIRLRIKKMFMDFVRLSELGKTAQIGATPFSQGGILKNLLDEEKADLKDSTGGGSDTKKGSANKKDEDLERAKTRLNEYKSFLSEYKKYREIYSKEKAIGLLEDLFPNLKGQGLEIIDNYPQVLDKLRNSLEATTEERKKFRTEVDKTKADTMFDREKETIKENADAMKEYISRLEEMWKLYRSLMKKSGGNRDIAQMAFSENGAIWDETAKNLLARFNKRGQELGVMPVNFRWDMNEKELKQSLVNAEGQVQDELVELAKEIQKIIRGNFTQFLEDSASAYSHSLTAAQKLAELEREREELIRKRDAENDPDNIKGWDAQIAASNKEIAKQTWEAFKETEEWGRIFSNLDNVSTTALEGMLGRLRELAPSLQESAEGTKAVYEAMDKLEETISNRNPIKAMLGSLGRMNSIRDLVKNGVSDIGFRNERGTYTIGAADARRIGLAVKKSGEYTDEDLEGAERGAMTDFERSLQDVTNKFKAIEDILSPVIDLFDQLGNESLSDMFSMGGNAIGAAAQAAGGLNSLGLGNLGPYGAAAAAALSVVSSIAAMHDKSLQKEIEASEARQKEMENVTKNLEKVLERTLGGVYNTRAGENAISSLTKEIANQFLGIKDNVANLLNIDNKSAFKDYIGEATIKAVKEAEKTKTYYDAAYASLLAQRDEVQHQMQMEEDKKKSDSDKIADYKQQLIEMDDEIKHFAEDMAKSLYDIDVKSWASELGDALFEAWQKGEDGADAFKKKASEIIADVAKNIVTTKLIETAMQPILDLVVSEMQRTKGMLDEVSVARISSEMAAIGQVLPDSFNSLMDGLNDGIKKAGLTDLKELGNESGSSSLSNGIKGITEQTADLLASYVNAIRADVSVIRANYEVNLPSISSAVQRTSVLAEAQVALQTQIADNTYRSAELVASIERILVMAGKDKSFGFFMR